LWNKNSEATGKSFSVDPVHPRELFGGGIRDFQYLRRRYKRRGAGRLNRSR
jgi:hypothetical protein